jgi:hypothetical protein
MFQMQLCATIDQLFHRRHVALHQLVGICFNEVEERSIFDKRYLDCLRNPRTPVALMQGTKENRIIDHRKWRCEGPEEVLFTKSVDAILDTNS